MLRLIKYGFLLAILSAAPASAEPAYGKLNGINDGDVLDYECVRNPEGRIKCDFVQVLFSKESPEDDRASFVAALGVEDDVENEIAELCLPFQRRDRIFAGDTVPEDDATESARLIISELERSRIETPPESFEALKTQMDAWGEFCTSPSVDAANTLFDVIGSYAAQTCNPWINRFSLEFQEVDEHTWVAESSPSGPCGIVNTSKFVEDADFPDYWSYFASKIVTNKEGDALLPCGELDESEHPYLWNAPPIYKNCVFFE